MIEEDMIRRQRGDERKGTAPGGGDADISILS